jgi:hypothetical protein
MATAKIAFCKRWIQRGDVWAFVDADIRACRGFPLRHAAHGLSRRAAGERAAADRACDARSSNPRDGDADGRGAGASVGRPRSLRAARRSAVVKRIRCLVNPVGIGPVPSVADLVARLATGGVVTVQSLW